jgi:hypothetical protein
MLCLTAHVNFQEIVICALIRSVVPHVKLSATGKLCLTDREREGSGG